MSYAHRTVKKNLRTLLPLRRVSPESRRMSSLQSQSAHRLFNDIGGQGNIAIFKDYSLTGL